ncbi:MAG: LacI family DNA-binding transcriptional regulator [Sphingomonas sp.]
MARGTKRPTIIDVSKRAGVSPKTVSRVFNREANVSDGVRQRVRRAAKELNYHPNVFAQALVRQRSHLVGLLYDNPSPNYVVNLQMGMIARLQGERYRLMVVPVRATGDNAGDIVAQLRSAALDGVVIAPPVSDHQAILDALDAAGIRYTRISPATGLERAPYTMMDDVAAAQEIADHVIALGHRDIAIIKGDPTHPATEQRLTGYRRAIAAAGLTVPETRIAQGYFSFESGLAAAHELLARPTRPTAILAQNDDMAVGAMVAARELNLDLPADLSVTGFDDSQLSRVAWPRITTIRQPVFEMAQAAADMLIATLEDEESTAPHLHAHELLIRGSTAPPRRGNDADGTATVAIDHR